MAALTEYNMKLYDFCMQFRNVPAVSTKIELRWAGLDFYPKGHAAHTSFLGGLGHSFHLRYQIEGNSSDLNRAIDIGQKRLDLCPPGHQEHVSAPGHLAVSLQYHYEIHKNEVDLERIIEMQQRMLDLCPLSHPDHTLALGHLTTSLTNHYYAKGDVNDLNRAIEMGQRRLELCPPGHPEHATAIGSLAVSLDEHYHMQGNLADLDKAIELKERKLEFCPPGHQSHGLALYSLAWSLREHYGATKNQSNLNKAIKLFKEALDNHPAQHRHFAAIVEQLTETILLSNSSPQDAFETFKRLKACGPAVSPDLWDATQAWVKNAEKYNHPSVLEAYQTTLNTLDHLTSMQSSLDSRHETMQARVADLANNAFSCAMRYNDLSMGVELLEQGRGILWNQLARFDISIVALESRGKKGCELGDK